MAGPWRAPLHHLAILLMAQPSTSCTQFKWRCRVASKQHRDENSTVVCAASSSTTRSMERIRAAHEEKVPHAYVPCFIILGRRRRRRDKRRKNRRWIGACLDSVESTGPCKTEKYEINNHWKRRRISEWVSK